MVYSFQIVLGFMLVDQKLLATLQFIVNQKCLRLMCFGQQYHRQTIRLTVRKMYQRVHLLVQGSAESN